MIAFLLRSYQDLVSAYFFSGEIFPSQNMSLEYELKLKEGISTEIFSVQTQSGLIQVPLLGVPLRSGCAVPADSPGLAL